MPTKHKQGEGALMMPGGRSVRIPETSSQVKKLDASVGSLTELRSRSVLAAGAVVTSLMIWAYYQPIAGLVDRWWSDPDYVYGFLVPVFSLFLLWHRRDMLQDVTCEGSWWGLAMLVVAGLVRWTSAQYFYALIDPLSLIPTLAGFMLLVGGWKLLRWSWPGIIFLAFMVPLPGFLADQFSHPLQRIGTISGTYTIQTIGIPAVARGNVIHMPSAELGVVEACSGLRMMMLFFAVCAAVALYVKRSTLEKVILVGSAIPIALLANIVRIFVTAILYELAGPAWGDKLFHDLAGWFMMPLAVAILWLEIEIMDRIVVRVRPGRLDGTLPHLT